MNERAQVAADKLISAARDGQTALIGHGWFNRAIAKTLVEQGWQRTSANGRIRQTAPRDCAAEDQPDNRLTSRLRSHGDDRGWAVEDFVAAAVVASAAADIDIDDYAIAWRDIDDIFACRRDRPRQFVSWDQREPIGRVVAVEDMHLRAANPATINPNQGVIRPNLGNRNIAKREPARRGQHGRTHCCRSWPVCLLFLRQRHLTVLTLRRSIVSAMAAIRTQPKKNC